MHDVAGLIHRRYLYRLVVAAGCGIIGLAYLLGGYAASFTQPAEAENGALTTGASVVADSAASGGKTVKFTAAGTGGGGNASAATPCVGAAAPAKWNHVVVLMFENRVYDKNGHSADGFGPWFDGSVPYTTSLVSKCGSYVGWKDVDYSVTGSNVGSFNSKPSYALLTNGVPAASSGITDDDYQDTTNVDNIYNRLNQIGKDAKDYYSGPSSSTPCASVDFNGDYHDAIRYYENLGAQSSSSSSYCNTHDKPISQFMSDVTAGKLPAFSMILPTNSQNGHDNSNATADSWAKSFLDPLLDSAQYKSGDTAVFFLWDEDSPIPNVLLAPSIKAGSHPPAPSGAPISHYAALRTFQEMLGITPLLGNTGQAPSLLQYFNGQ